MKENGWRERVINKWKVPVEEKNALWLKNNPL